MSLIYAKSAMGIVLIYELSDVECCMSTFQNKQQI